MEIPEWRPGVVVVTGAGRGLGAALAIGLAREGWDVGLIARTDTQIEQVAAQIDAMGRRAVAVTADVRQPRDVGRSMQRIDAELGAIDALVNNAGVQRVGPALGLTEADWDAVLDTNLKGAFFCMQAVAPGMIERGHGSVVNIASVAGQLAVPDRAPYAASKAGLLMLTRACAVEWAYAGVRVNAVSPTFVDTDLARQTLDQPGALETILGRIPLGRLATPADVVAAVAFLLDEPRAGFITGEVLTVDGGLRA